MRKYRFRLYPSAEQRRTLNEQLNLCRDLYNAFLQQRIYAHRMGIKINFYYQQNQMPELRKGIEEYSQIHSQVLQDVALRVDRAYQNFFRRVKEKKSGTVQKAGFPRFKPSTRYSSITYPQSGFEILENGHLKLSKIGRIRMFQYREIEGEIKTLTISRDATGKWYASFSVEQEDDVIRPEKTGRSVGVDAGLSHLFTMSDGTTVDPPRFFSMGKKNIIKAHRSLSRKKKGSNNRGKARIGLAKRYQKVERQREDFAHKLSNDIVKENDLIVFEKLNIAGMMKNHHLARSIADATWYRVMQYTAYKAESAGKQVMFVNPRGTSKRCSRCGEEKDSLKLSTRIFRCDSCGYETDRDVNASINIHRIGLQELGRGTPEYTPVEIGALPERASPVNEAGSPLH